MNHEVKIASDEQVEKITMEVIAENKNLLKRLEQEEGVIVIENQESITQEFLEYATRTNDNFSVVSADRTQIESISSEEYLVN